MELTDRDLRRLGGLTTRDEAGTHFTRRYPREWLDTMEQTGAIKIHRPVHDVTRLEYSEEYWTVEVTEEAAQEGEARGWGMEPRETIMDAQGGGCWVGSIADAWWIAWSSQPIHDDELDALIVRAAQEEGRVVGDAERGAIVGATPQIVDSALAAVSGTGLEDKIGRLASWLPFR